MEPVTLEGRSVQLEPLSASHHAALCEVGLDPELWQWIPIRVTSPDEMMSYIQSALKDRDAGVSFPFATVERSAARVVGCTRFMNIDMANRRLEIGSTWIGLPWQRSAINTEAKFLMLQHAFETLGCVRVELKTDAMNQQSRNAILRLGAKQEGLFRKHVQTWSGRIRDTVYFSILDSDWPRVKADLERKRERGDPAGPLRLDALNGSQIEDLYLLYQNEWWSQGRTREDIRRILDASPIVVGFADPKTGRLIAFARVLTDLAFKGLIFDVIVDPAARGQGLGQALIDAIVSHPVLAAVQHFELYCRPELVPFYQRFGFQEVPADVRFLRRG